MPHGMVGLAHVSQMTTCIVSHYAHQGDQVLVRTLSIDPDRQRIILSSDAAMSEEYVTWLDGNSQTILADGISV